MATLTRHTGRLKTTGQRCVVVYRKLPDDEDHALIVQTDQLRDMYHDNLMDVIKGKPAQSTHELYEVLSRNKFGDGSPMLATLHHAGYLKKMPVDQIVLLPYPNHPLELADANRQIDEDLRSSEKAALKVLQEETEVDVETRQDVEISEPVTNIPADAEDPTAIAANLIKQAELMQQDVDRLLEQAYELDPTTRPKKGRPTLSDEEKERRKQIKNKKRREQYAKQAAGDETTS